MSWKSGFRSLFRWKVARAVLLVLAALFLAIQVKTIDRTNPPVETEMPAPPEVRALLQRACYDCHSNETVWPWYSRVAPVSWLLAEDVAEARDELNFSTWNRNKPERRLKKMKEIWKEVEEGEMPLWFYIPLHREAKLSPADLALLKDWTERTAAELGEEMHREERLKGIPGFGYISEPGAPASAPPPP